ncbi:Histone-lysine N-methyltransferase [Coemansia sp. RSA 2610]|nr:Histone-lysine N-methyltransferase [Coemansia sp. RSA 2610]
MGGERQHKERSRSSRNAQTASGKVSIGDLVEAGLLNSGNIVVCNSWPFSAVVTNSGTFDARWTPVPASFAANVGTEFMRSSFETPSAWATAVCRVMRAQARAQRQGDDEGARAAIRARAGESRVAVNGWTACRVQVRRGDGSWELARRLDSDATGDVIEVPLDALRRELSVRMSRRVSAGAAQRSARGGRARRSMDMDRELPSMARDSGSDNNSDGGQQRQITADELQEITGAVDGLAKRVESGLALGCVQQRRAAALAADAITAAAASSSISVRAATNGSISNGSANLTRKHMHSRKRKSIPDMSRHAKQSRVPTDDSSDGGNAALEQLDAATRSQLVRFRERAEQLTRAQPELKALRYQRKQQLKRRIAHALDVWLHQRRKHAYLAALGLSADSSALPTPLPASLELSDAVATVSVPALRLERGLPQLCAACGASGALAACRGCGDRYHGFCVADSTDPSRLVCAACRVCAQCNGRDQSDLLQCDECHVHVHAQCSGQSAQASDGLIRAVRESGRWVCDSCVRCSECGFTMESAPRDGDWAQRVSWAHDFRMCGVCAQSFARGKVCPECVTTYGDGAMACCDACQFWVHAACDPALTSRVYDALITLEDSAYACPRCRRGSNYAAGRSELSDSESDAVETPWLPRCLRKARKCELGDIEESDAANTLLDGKCETPASLAMSPAYSSVSGKSEPEMTEEAANMLLSLTRSDVRFGHDRFDVDTLELRFCRRQLRTRCGSIEDWRACVLCGLRGDGLSEAPSLGRLVPLPAAESKTPAWIHVECLAWAWGPRPVSLGGGTVRFEGAFTDTAEKDMATLPACTLCRRPNASFHCCAPVPCFDTAFHLPCLLVAGCPSPHVAADREQYCAAWRRALCAAHAPMFSTMMPADGAIESQLYDAVRVQARVDSSGLDEVKREDCLVGVVGSGLVVLSWGRGAARLPPASGLRCVRVFDAGGQSYALGIEAVADAESVGEELAWRGWIEPGVRRNVTAWEPPVASAASLPELVALLFARAPQIAASGPLAAVLAASAAADPLRFLGLSRLIP